AVLIVLQRRWEYGERGPRLGTQRGRLRTARRARGRAGDGRVSETTRRAEAIFRAAAVSVQFVRSLRRSRFLDAGTFTGRSFARDPGTAGLPFAAPFRPAIQANFRRNPRGLCGKSPTR